jgi:hypothetical protein
MQLKQISIFIENAPGRLYDVTHELGKAKINLRALTLADTADFGVLRLLVSDISTTRQIVMKKGLPARVDDVVAVEIEDRPGALAELLKPLMDANVNIKYMYAYGGGSTNQAVMIFNFSNNDKGIDILKQKGFRLLGPEAFGIMESI